MKKESTDFSTVGKGKYQVEQTITDGKTITLQARGDEQARWKLHVIPDLPPDDRFLAAHRRRQVVDQDRVRRR